MTIRKGEDWGTPGALPDGGVLARSDAEVRRLLELARREGRPVPAVGLLGGDLCRTVGGRGDEGRIRSDSAVRLPVDVGEALLDGELRRFCAHLVARRGWWRGRAWLAMNAQWLGAWNAAPRAHPGDGLLEVLDARVPLNDRLKVRSRLRLGEHLPHPAIATRRVPAAQVALDPPLDVWLDGERVARGVRSISVRLDPGALTVVV